MNEKKKKRLLKYGLGTLACLLVGGLNMVDFNFAAAGTVEILNLVGDVFSVPGGLAILVGILIILMNEGVFTGFGYMGKILGKMVNPKSNTSSESYSEYVQRKTENKTGGFGFLFILGGIFVAIGAVFFIIAANI